MASPIRYPSGFTATNCLALPTPKFAKVLTPTSLSSRSASWPWMKRSVMWWDWSSSAQVSTHDRCSERQLVNSGFTGKVLGGKLRFLRSSTGLSARARAAARLLDDTGPAPFIGGDADAREPRSSPNHANDPTGHAMGRHRSATSVLTGVVRGRAAGWPPDPGDRRGSAGGRAPPAFVVGLPRHLGVGNRAHGGADLELLVRLDGGLLAATVGLAPDHADLGAVRDVGADGGQGQALLLVRRDAGEHRQAQQRAVGVDHLVEVRRPVVGVGKVEELVPGVPHRSAEELGEVVGVPLQGDLAALRVLVHGLEGVTADEVVVELDERAVPEVPRVGVVVLDVVGHEAAGDGVGRLVAVRPQPLPVGTHLLAGVDGRQRRGDPPGLEGVGRVCPRADGLQAELPAGLEDGVADAVVALVGAQDLPPRRPGQAFPQRADGVPADVHGAHPEELQLLQLAAVELLDDRPGVGALDLEAPQVAGDGLAVRPRGRPGIVADLDVVAPGLALELQPVGAGGAADADVLLLGEAEQDAVTDDIAGR